MNNKDDFFSNLEEELSPKQDSEWTKKDFGAESPEFSATIEDNYDFINKSSSKKDFSFTLI